MTSTRRPARPRTDVYQDITDQVIAQLEAGAAPWHQPWVGGAGFPRSLSTGKPYRGVNVFLLGMAAAARGYRSPWWGTYKQIAANGGQVRKGERGTAVIFWKVDHRVDPDTGEARRLFLLRTYSVFNAGQADGLPAEYAEDPAPLPRENDRIAACDEAVAAYLAAGPGLRVAGDAAYYAPARDEVVMPPRELFITPEHYYGALFHELTHSTGHATRLDRPGITDGHRFGDADYSREELIAEMGAAMLSGTTGIAAVTLPGSASYLQSWIGVLRGDKRLIIAAAGAAQKAADLILDTSPTAAEPVEQLSVPVAAPLQMA